MKSAKLILSLAVGMALSACQSIQPFDGQSGYQREASPNSKEVILSYILDAKSSPQTTQNKLQKACAKELGVAKGTTANFKTLYEKEFVNLSTAKNAVEQQSIAIGNSQRASFGLSSTPKLSNNDTGSINMLDSKPSVLKQITVQCIR
jgi:hypothetical protein